MLRFISFLIYGLLGATFISALCVFLKKNPIHAVLSLIFTFFFGSFLILINDGEFLAFLILTVYVGAVAVLFLFSVMMIDFDKIPDSKNSLEEKISVAVLSCVLLCCFFFTMKAGVIESVIAAGRGGAASISSHVSQVELIGATIFDSEYCIALFLVMMILFATAICLITLVVREKTGIKKQNLGQQLRRNAKTLTMCNIGNNSGVSDV